MPTQVFTFKVQPAAGYWTVDRENLGTRLCYFWWAEKRELLGLNKLHHAFMPRYDSSVVRTHECSNWPGVTGSNPEHRHFSFSFYCSFLLRMNRIFFQNSSVTFLRRIPQHEVTMHEIIVLACVAGVIRKAVVATKLPFYAGAIIGDGDRKSPSWFLALGQSVWYGTFFLILEQIVPSPEAHARTCCGEFCGCRVGEMVSEIPEKL